jgi:class 3 adenylate cyclase
MATTTRKLAAIMFSDIVGYTSLMANDEKKAFDTPQEKPADPLASD